MLSLLKILPPRLMPMQQTVRALHITAINEAARKHTRAKADKKKVKREIKKIGWIPDRLKKKTSAKSTDKHADNSPKLVAIDNVYSGNHFQTRLFSIADAIEAHREVNSPTMLDSPNASIIANIELNMDGEKPTKPVNNFTANIMIEHSFDHGEIRSVIAFVKDQKITEEARQAGAEQVGGTALIKSVQDGKILLTDFQYVVAHPEILPELIAIRGLLKKRFPSPKLKTLGTDVGQLVRNFATGIVIKGERDPMQVNFGSVETRIGTLQMTTEQIKSNLLAVLDNVNPYRPKRQGPFITRVFLTSPPSQENLRIDHKEFPFEDFEGLQYPAVKKTTVEPVKKKKAKSGPRIVKKEFVEEPDVAYA